MFFWYFKIIADWKGTNIEAFVNCNWKKYFRMNCVTLRIHSSLFLSQYLKKNTSIYGQLINSVLSLLFREQLLGKKKKSVIVNIKVRGKIQISLEETNTFLQNLTFSHFFPQSVFCTKLEEIPQSLGYHPNQNSNPG